MTKKIVLAVVILGLFGGGFFYWQKSQADVRELNKGFSGEEKIVKDWRGNYFFVRKIDGKMVKMIKVMKQNDQYKIINDRYNYEFLLPKDRVSFWRLEYLEKEGKTDMEYVCRICETGSMLFIGLVGGEGDNMTIESYKPKDQNITLDDFAKKGNPTWLYKMDIEKIKMGNIDIIMASREYGKENERGRFYNYFFWGESNFYKLEHVSKEFLDYLILNGKW